MIACATWPPGLAPTFYISGPAGFVDMITGLLMAARHRPTRLRTEPFAGAQPAPNTGRRLPGMTGPLKVTGRTGCRR